MPLPTSEMFDVMREIGNSSLPWVAYVADDDGALHVEQSEDPRLGAGFESPEQAIADLYERLGADAQYNAAEPRDSVD